MAYTEATRKKRAEAREAASAARRQRLEDARAELRALKKLLAANRRLREVDVWLDGRVADLNAQADARRATHRREAAAALADMAGRGVTVEEIARMAGMTVEAVHNYLHP